MAFKYMHLDALARSLLPKGLQEIGVVLAVCKCGEVLVSVMGSDDEEPL